MEDSTIRWFGGVMLASLLLVLSYAFFLQEGSGNVPVVLLFAGLLLAFLLVIIGLTGIGGAG